MLQINALAWNSSSQARNADWLSLNLLFDSQKSQQLEVSSKFKVPFIS
jgi:hypothetical protein